MSTYREQTSENLTFSLVAVSVTIILGAFVALLWAWPLTWSWNFVMPSMFGLPKITYWKMWNLYFILSALWKVVVLANVGGRK